jgi:mannose-1-phosphate guanylyltransferase
MAGGSGERFWPASRSVRPKQLLRLTDPKLSMLEEAIERIAPLIPPEDIVIATSEALAEPIARAIPALQRSNVLAEPAKRNTAACLGFAAAHLVAERGDPSQIAMAVLTADHQIGRPDVFRATVDAALGFAERNDALVTIGCEPDRPETGYGYIEIDEQLAEATPVGPVHRVARFREKPNLATAEEYARSGRHLWNSGMFFWRVSTLLEGFDRHMPALAAAIPAMRESLGEHAARPVARERLAAAFAPLEDVPIDIGLMERARNVYVIRARFPWDDVGAWDSLTRTRERDAAGNVNVGDAILVDAHDCIVYNEPGAERMAVAVIGLDDVVVATTQDGVLVCRKDRAQEVRRAVAELRKRGRDRMT